MFIPYVPPPIALDSYEFTTRFKGLTIAVETPKGAIRYGKGWQHKLSDDYGYIEGYPKGADGDDVDCYLGPNLNSEVVWIVDQNQLDNPSEFDEHKVMLGFNSENDAKRHYIINHSKGAQIFSKITKMTLSEFKNWLSTGNHFVPIGA